MLRKCTLPGLLALGLLALLVWAPGCGMEKPSSEETKLGSLQQKIVNGIKNQAYPAVGSLTGNKTTFCTGTLIAPKVVITAAHCVDAFTRLRGQTLAFRIDIPFNQNEYRTIYPGIDIANSKKHPQYSGQNKTPITNDIAVVILTTPIFVVPSMPFNTKKADTSWLGKQALFMGYGRLSAATQTPAPRKYSTFLKLTHLNKDAQTGGPKPNTIGYSGNNTSVCQGDSGGPALLEIDGKMRVIGVTSHGTTFNCTGTSYSFRTDPYVTWIQSFIDKYSTCTGASPTCGKCGKCDKTSCAPNPVSNTSQVCKVCQKDSDCGKGRCIQVGSGLRCVQRCDASNCCPTGSFCTTSNGKNYCLPEAMACPPVTCKAHSDCSSAEFCDNGKCAQKLPTRRKTTCQPCTKNSECGPGGFCQNPGGRGGRCLQPCEGVGELCPKDYVCSEVTTGLKQCVRRDKTCAVACKQDDDCLGGLKCQSGTCQRPGGGQAGEPCNKSATCKTGLQCIPSVSGARCYQTCGFQAGQAGAPCKGTLCDDGLRCMNNPAGGGNLCVRQCSSATDCKNGGTCFPRINICTCQQDADCKNGATCNIIIQGIAGVCASGKQAPCPTGEVCASSPGQASICVKKGSGNRSPGQTCNNLNRCKEGASCVPGLNRCLETCGQTGNACTDGGACRSVFGRQQFCLCSNNSECKNGKQCQILGQGLGYCANPPSAGCTKDSCPEGFLCKDKKCIAKDAPPVEPAQEAPAQKDGGTAENGTIEKPASGDTVATSDTPSKTGGEANTNDNTKPPSACGCETQPSSQQLPFSWLLLLGFFGLLLRRKIGHRSL